MDILNKIYHAFMGGYASINVDISDILICIVCTLILSLYIFIVYKDITKHSFYNQNFNLSLIALAVIIAAIILTIQSNVVVSLGMVGALSIVRFRTAIKDPMDLVFLFWSISVGIICGAGYVLIAVVASLAITVILMISRQSKNVKADMMLVINTRDYRMEQEIIKCVAQYTSFYRVKARNVSNDAFNMAIQISSQKVEKIVDNLANMDGVISVSIVDCEGDVTV